MFLSSYRIFQSTAKAQADVSHSDVILTVKRLQYNPKGKNNNNKNSTECKETVLAVQHTGGGKNLHCSDFRVSFKELF